MSILSKMNSASWIALSTKNSFGKSGLSDSIVSMSFRARSKVAANRIACFRSLVIGVRDGGIARNAPRRATHVRQPLRRGNIRGMGSDHRKQPCRCSHGKTIHKPEHHKVNQKFRVVCCYPGCKCKKYRPVKT